MQETEGEKRSYTGGEGMIPNGKRIPGDQMRRIKEENGVRAADLKHRERE